jgi:adenylate cyclase, class 2
MLDETPVGNFLELEGTPRWIGRTAKLLGFSQADYITGSYGYLHMLYCREHGLKLKDMLFISRRNA